MTPDFSGGYKLTGTGWRILRALLDGPLKPHAIMVAADLGNAAVARELPSLDLAGLVDELTTGRYRITDEGRALAAKPCPVRAQKKPAPPSPIAPIATVANLPLLPGERTVLELIAAHEGKSLGEMAKAACRCPHNIRGHLTSLETRGLVTLSAARGVALVPRLTDAGRGRLTRKERAPVLSRRSVMGACVRGAL